MAREAVLGRTPLQTNARDSLTFPSTSEGVLYRVLKIHPQRQLYPPRTPRTRRLQEQLIHLIPLRIKPRRRVQPGELRMVEGVVTLEPKLSVPALAKLHLAVQGDVPVIDEIGRASCRERV